MGITTSARAASSHGNSPNRKRKTSLHAAALIAATTILTFADHALAAPTSLTWAPGGSATGGSGTWDINTPNFTDGTNEYAWDNSDPVPVTFAGSSAAITLNGTINATAGITFAQTGTSSTHSQLTLTGGSLNIGGGTITVLSQSNASTSINVPLSGSGGFVKDGPGTLLIGPAATYTGGTTIVAGTLDFLGSKAISDTAGSLTLSNPGATLLTPTGLQVTELNGVEGTAIGNSSNQPTVTAAAGTFNGSISGSVVKIGSGNLSLASAPSFLTVKAGTVSITQSASARSVIVGASATLDAGSFPQYTLLELEVAGGRAIGNFSIVAPADGFFGAPDSVVDAGEIVGDVSISGSTPTSTDAPQIIIDLDALHDTSDLIKIDGQLSVLSNTRVILPAASYYSGETFNIISYGTSFTGALNSLGGLHAAIGYSPSPGYSVSLVNDTQDHLIQAVITSTVPEPASLSLLLLGMSLLSRRRKPLTSK